MTWFNTASAAYALECEKKFNKLKIKLKQKDDEFHLAAAHIARMEEDLENKDRELKKH